jgi:hypothetical protein
LRARPLTQLERQKLALSPLPTVTMVEELKSSRSVLSYGISSLVQSRSADFQMCHCHLNLNALAKRSRSRMPKPPRSLGAKATKVFGRARCRPVDKTVAPTYLFRLLSLPKEASS